MILRLGIKSAIVIICVINLLSLIIHYSLWHLFLLKQRYALYASLCSYYHISCRISNGCVFIKNALHLFSSLNGESYIIWFEIPIGFWCMYRGNCSDLKQIHVTSWNALRWRHDGRDGVSNHQPHDCLPKRLFRRRSKETSKLRVTGFCVGNSPVTAEFRAQRASNAENVSIWWRHHDNYRSCRNGDTLYTTFHLDSMFDVTSFVDLQQVMLVSKKIVTKDISD